MYFLGVCFMQKTKNNIKQVGITALYSRVSTDYQFEEGYSIDVQEQKLKQWCQLKDITDYQMYTDGGWSGSNIKRPAIKELIDDIVAHKIARVVVYKLDRLSRSQKDTLYLLEDVFLPNGVDFVSLNENFDTSTSYGKAMIGILSVFAQLERENIRERTRMGMYERVKSGFWMGGSTTPFGYDYDANQDILVPNEHAADVKAIFDLYLEGYSTTKLSTMFPVSSDHSITMMLDRITYLGKIRYKGEVFQGRHEAIIDEDTWNKVQAERKRRSTKNTVSSNYLLTGLLFCGKCGAKMRYQKWSGNIVKIYCYSQQKSKPYLVKDPNCDNGKYNSDELERIVLEDLFGMTDHITANNDADTVDDCKRSSTIELLKQKYDALKSKVKRLYNLYATSANDLLLETIEENQKEMLSIEQILERESEAKEAAQQQKIDRAMIQNLRNIWDSLTMQEKHRALRLCINKIVITDGSVDIYYQI